MKRFIIVSLIAAVAISFFSCTEYENPVEQRGVGVVATLSNVNPAVFDSKDMENTFVKFDVVIDDQFKSSVSEAIVEVSINGNLNRKEVTRISSFPSSVQIKLTDVASKLGMNLNDIKLGDVITLEILTVSNGKSYRSNAVINAGVVCAYDPTMVSGSYHSVSPDWGSEGDITITVDPEDEYTLYVSGLEEMEGLTEDVGPLVLVINPVDYSVEAPRTIMVSSLEPWGLTYTNLAYGGEGTLNTCDGTFEMSFEISVDQGSFGAYAFTFTKN